MIFREWPAVEPPFTATCKKCGCRLRKTKYPRFTSDRYWFDEKGLAGCETGFHEGWLDGSTTIDMEMSE